MKAMRLFIGGIVFGLGSGLINCSCKRYRVRQSPEPTRLSVPSQSLSSASLTMSSSSNSTFIAPVPRQKEIPNIPGLMEATEREEKSPSVSASSSSSVLSPLSGRSERSSADIGYDLQLKFEGREIAACKIYNDDEQEKLVILYRDTDEMSGTIGVLVDLESGRQLAEFKGCSLRNQNFYGIERFPGTNKLMVTAGHRIQIFDMETGKRLHAVELRETQRIVQLTCCADDFFYLTLADQSVLVSQYREGKICEFQQLPFLVQQMVWNSDHTLCAFSDDKGSVHVWDPRERKCIDRVSIDEGKLTAFAIDKNRLVTAYGERAYVWEINQNKKLALRDESIFGRDIFRIILDPRGKYCAYIFTNNKIYVQNQYQNQTNRREPITVVGTIEDVWFDGDFLKISVVDDKQVHSLQIRDLSSGLLQEHRGGSANPSRFATYGKRYAVYGEEKGTLFCTSFLPIENGVAEFIQALPQMSRNTYVFLSDSPEQQKNFENFSPFTQHYLENQYPFLITQDDQRRLLKTLVELQTDDYYVFTDEQERAFRSLPLKVQKKITQDYVMVLHPNKPCNLLARSIQQQGVAVVAPDPFNEIPDDIRRYLRKQNSKLIVNDNMFVRAFWRCIDAVGLGYFSRRTIRICTTLFVAAALGIGGWRAWVKYRKAVLVA